MAQGADYGQYVIRPEVERADERINPLPEIGRIGYDIPEANEFLGGCVQQHRCIVLDVVKRRLAVGALPRDLVRQHGDA